MAAAPSQDSGEKTDEPRAITPRYQPLVIVLVAVCVGIVADRFWPLPLFAWWTAAAFGWGVWAVLRRRDFHAMAAVPLLLAVAATAGAWHHLRWSMFDRHDLGHFTAAETQPVCLEAIARKTPERVPAPPPDPLRAMPLQDHGRLELDVVSIRDHGDWRPASGRTQLSSVGYLPEVRPGDRVRIFAQLSAPGGVRNPGGFDYAGYLRTKRSRGMVRTQSPLCVSVVEPACGWSIARPVHWARSHGDRTLRRYIDQRTSPLAAAVLLGSREGLAPDRKEAFQETGTIHLLAISGLHVGILAGALLWIVCRAPIPRGPAMLGVAAATVFYMLVTDARPPVIRATILVLVACGALYLNRRPLSFNSLAVAALIVLAVNPAELFQVGFQLSFLAVTGLMWFGPLWMARANRDDPLERLIAANRPWWERLPRRGGSYLWVLACMSATIWLLTMPLAMARFHLFSPIAVPMNTLLWLPMTVSLMAGFATLVFGGVSAPLAQLSGYFCNASLGFLQSSVEVARDVPGGHFWVPGPGNWWLAGFYGGLALLAAVPRIRPPRRWCLALLAGWSAVGFAAAGLRHDDQRLDCTFLSVGHGCAVVLELPSGQTMLYDAGQFSSPVTGSRSIAGFLWLRGITHLDAVVLSHPDLDHYNALPGLLRQFSVGVIYVSPMMFQQPNEAVAALQEAIRRSGVPVEAIQAGDRLAAGDDCRIEVLHPTAKGVAGGDNANSIVLNVDYLGHHILLPADLDTPGLDDVLAEEPIDFDVLLAPHHGSRRSNPPGLAAWSTPEWVVISGSRRWDLSAIEATYRAAGCEILHTADAGAVSVTIDASGVSVDGYLAGHD